MGLFLSHPYGKMTGMPPGTLLITVVLSAAGGVLLGCTMGYRWGRATTRWQDWRNTVKGLPKQRSLVFTLVRKALNPTGLLLAIVITGIFVVYVRDRIN